MTDSKNNILGEHLASLNEKQREAVLHFGSSLLIRAGAGSGKTRVITTKIAYLIEEKNIMPQSILALTFTNKAAAEMKERAISISPKASEAMLKTFHSFGVWFLRQYGTYLGLQKHFTIYDVEASYSLLAHIKLRISSTEKYEMNFSKTQEIKDANGLTYFEVTLTQKEVKYFYEKISRAKDYCLTPSSPNLAKIDDSSVFRTLYTEYQKRLEETGNADFGDLILLPYLILKENSEIRAKMHNRFLVILVDEYQDTNVAQVELLKLLVGNFQYLCVVGDEDQAIYKFRGAEIKNILEFENTFKDCKVITLDENYRSYANILNVANSIIAHNGNRSEKELKATRGDGLKTQILILANQDIEATYAGTLLQKYTQYGYSIGDWAIIYRTNRQSNTFETVFLNMGIPYVVVGGMEFYQREEVRDAIALVSLIANGRDEVALRRLMTKYIAGLGEKKCDDIINSTREYMMENQGILHEDVFQNDFIQNVPYILKNIKRLNKEARPKIEEFIAKIQELRNILQAEKKVFDVRRINQVFINTLAVFLDHALNFLGIYSYYKELDKQNKTDKEGNLNEFVASATSYECNPLGLISFLDYIDLREELEAKDGRQYENSAKLMSMHTTKGLEFKNVIVTGLEKGLFPRYEHDEEEVEEERRLMYVACTRARDNLFITSCRYRKSVINDGYATPSMFLSEIDENLVEAYEIGLSGKMPISLSSLYGTRDSKYRRFIKVRHKQYGYGLVESVETVEGEESVKIYFFEIGETKIFLPEYTKDLEIVENYNP